MSRMNGIPMGDVPLIGQQQQPQGLACCENDGHLATPIVVPALTKGPGGLAVVQSFGGLTKLEHGAFLLAATMHEENESYAAVAENAANLAEAVLAECAKRQPELHQSAPAP